jgi:hypothetical protein
VEGPEFLPILPAELRLLFPWHGSGENQHPSLSAPVGGKQKKREIVRPQDKPNHLFKLRLFGPRSKKYSSVQIQHLFQEANVLAGAV